MAVRIYGPNQKGGVQIATTGKGNITNDGMTAFAEAVAIFDGDTGLPAPSGGAASPYYVSEIGQPYVDASIASLTANQANGVTAIFNVDTTRQGLVINPPANCGLTLTSGGPVNWPLFANVPNSFSGTDCPTGALYLTAGLVAGQALAIAVA